jgi:hypothetical protein
MLRRMESSTATASSGHRRGVSFDVEPEGTSRPPLSRRSTSGFSISGGQDDRIVVMEEAEDQPRDADAKKGVAKDGEPTTG